MSNTVVTRYYSEEERQQLMAALAVSLDVYHSQDANNGCIPTMFSEGEDALYHGITGVSGSDEMLEKARLGIRLLINQLKLTEEERRIMAYPLEASIAGTDSFVLSAPTSEDVRSPKKAKKTKMT